MAKITLDAEAFKVLASDTRLSILKALDDRPKTVSELSRELDLNKATVHEHLQQLVAGELAKKKAREGRKWVYYTLSWKGKHLLHPENTTVLVLLSLAAVGSGAAVVQLGNWLRWWGQGAALDALGGDEDADVTPESSPDAAGDGASTADQDQGAAGSEPADDTADGSTNRTEQAAALPEEDAGSSDSDGGMTFYEDGEFWWFAVLALVATALAVAAMVVRARANR